MPLPVSIDKLEIIGYANELKDTMLPSVVAAVFRLKDDRSSAFVPPYLLTGTYLCNATVLTAAEVKAHKENQEITLFSGPALQAQPGFELWLDQVRAPHYESQGNARVALLALAKTNIESAEAALRNGRTADAERFCGVALCADDRLVEPLAIKAAIRRRQRDSTGERLMSKLALPRMTNEAFRALVDHYCLMLPPASATSPSP